jgi:hypothetical protein
LLFDNCYPRTRSLNYLIAISELECGGIVLSEERFTPLEFGNYELLSPGACQFRVSRCR